MSQILQSIFDSDTGYIFDDNKIAVEFNQVHLKPIVIGAEAALYVKLDENKGLVAIDSSGNNIHGAFQGGYTENNWTTGKINSAIVGISTTNGFINFNQLLEFERTEAFSIECWFNSTSSATMSLVSKQKDTGTFEGFGINVLLGKPRLVIRDISSNVISVESVNAYNDGLWHHVVMTYDGNSAVAGAKLYIDGSEERVIVQSGTLTSTIKNNADLQVSGRDGNNITIDSNTKIDEVLIYSRELNSAEITFRYNSGNGTQQIPGASTAYAIDNPTIEPANFQLVTNILSFFSTVTFLGNDKITFVLVINGIDYWWNGSIWIMSSGYAESNIYQDINDNLVSLVLPGLSSVKWKAFLHSDNGDTTPVLTDVEFTYEIESQVITLNQAVIFGVRYGLDGNPVANEIIKVNSRWLIGDDTEIDDNQIQTITNQNGEWQIIISYENDLPNFLDWYFGTKYYQTNFVPGINKFSDLTILKEI